jgi:hypothetical protein
MGWIRRDSAWQQPFLVVPGSQPQGLSVWITLRPSSGLCAFRWVGTPRNQKRHKRPSFYWAFEALGSTKTGYFVESMLCMYECIIIYNDIYIYIHILFLYSTVLHPEIEGILYKVSKLCRSSAPRCERKGSQGKCLDLVGGAGAAGKEHHFYAIDMATKMRYIRYTPILQTYQHNLEYWVIYIYR